MSKRNISHKRGKQLYLNQMFLKGMLYTSSEMQEGYAKVIDNYDIAPTGDAASPRQPFKIPNNLFNFGTEHVYPVKFKQLENTQAYVRFKKTISENDFISDTVTPESTNPGKTVDVVYRNSNAFNDNSLELNTIDYSIENNVVDDDPSSNINNAISPDTNVVEVLFIPNENKFIIKENSNRVIKNPDTPLSYTEEEVSKELPLIDNFNIESTIEEVPLDRFLQDTDVKSCKLTLKFNLDFNICSNTVDIDRGFSRLGIDDSFEEPLNKKINHMLNWGYVPLTGVNNRNITKLSNLKSIGGASAKNVNIYLNHISSSKQQEINSIELETEIYTCDIWDNDFLSFITYAGFPCSELNTYDIKRHKIKLLDMLKYCSDSVDNFSTTYPRKKYLEAIQNTLGTDSTGAPLIYNESNARLNRTGVSWNNHYIIGTHTHYFITSNEVSSFKLPELNDGVNSYNKTPIDIDNGQLVCQIDFTGETIADAIDTFETYMNAGVVADATASANNALLNSVAFRLFTNVLSDNSDENPIELSIEIETLDGKGYNSMQDYMLSKKDYIIKPINEASGVAEIINQKNLEAQEAFDNLITDYHIIPHNSEDNFEVKDGDTFYHTNNGNTTEYRLWVADSVEKGYKWYHYSKYFLKELLTKTVSENSYLSFQQKGISYDRPVIDISLYYNPIITLQTPNSDALFDNTVNFLFNSYTVNVPHQFGWYGDDNANVSVAPFNMLGNIESNTPYISIPYLQYEDTYYYTNYKNVYTDSYYELSYKEFKLLKAFLTSGLYGVRAGVDLPEETLQLCTQYIEHAMFWRLHRWWHDKDEPIESIQNVYTDPYYNTTPEVLSPSQYDTTLKITNDMYIEALVLSDEYSISALTKTSLTYIPTIYVDYLDAFGFIGRIINHNNNSIVYKGLILLKALKEDQTYFTVLLPSKNGEGYEPSIIEASTNGYNLYNNELLHVNNTDDTNSPFTIQGISVLNTVYNTDLSKFETDYNNPVIITQGMVGQTVMLNAMLNEGYVINSAIANTDIWGYNISVYIPSIKYKNADEEILKDISYNYSINKSIDNPSNLIRLSIDTTELVSGDLEDIDIEIDSIELRKFELISPDNKVIDISLDFKDTQLKGDSLSKINTLLSSEDGLFELKIKTAINNSNTLITFAVYDNFYSPNKYLEEVSNNIHLSDRPYTPTLEKEYYAQWLIADYSSNEFIPLSQEFLLYKGSTTSSTLNKIEDVSEDFLWTINRSVTSSIKFSLQPKIRISADSSHPLYNYFIKNSFEELYQVYPRFEIGNEITTLSTSDITKNINIKNATKLDIFNRQIVLYGDHTKSNILQFSKFEKYDYYPFPLNTIELPESIVYVTNYKDALIIFGKTSIYMLSGSASVQECTLNKIYENLSCKLPDIKLIKPIGNNLMFFNNGLGYIIVPNTYVDSSSNIKVYKLTENISNFFYNPEEYIRVRLEEKGIPINITPTYTIKFDSYIENNTINIVANIRVFVPKEGLSGDVYYLSTIFIYNQDYRYWKMYSIDICDELFTNYICEPNLNTQFIIKNNTEYLLAYFENGTSDFQDNYANQKIIPIQTLLHSGYLSVDTMNDKRFKDIIIEFDQINANNTLSINFEFFVDSSPIILSSENILVIDKVNSTFDDVEPDNTLSEFINYSAHHISNNAPDNNSRSQSYGTVFDINNQKLSITGRTHVRIPVFGKGRLPSFILKIKAPKFYEFINYALIYKEKNINRRS